MLIFSLGPCGFRYVDETNAFVTVIKLPKWLVKLEALRTTFINPVLITPAPPKLMPLVMFSPLFPQANVPPQDMNPPSEIVKTLLVAPSEPRPIWTLPTAIIADPAPTTTPVFHEEEPPNKKLPCVKSLAPFETIIRPLLPCIFSAVVNDPTVVGP